MSMKRLTDERIAALIDMVPLNETIADIKSALVELQERRKANSEPVISIIIKDGWPEENTATPINGAPKLTDGTHELYAAPQPAPIAPDLSGIDMTNTFEDEELEMMSRGNNPRSNAYRELLAFRNAMGNQDPVRQPASNAQWIKCSERLPPVEYEPDFCLVWHKNEVECGSQYSITNVVFLRRHWEKWYSHWMPLPPGPEAENAND